VIQLVFTIVPAVSSRSLSAVIVIGGIFTALADALNNHAIKNSKKLPNAISPATKDDNDMLRDSVNIVNDSNNLANGEKKK
jgi:hypothetical protein